MVKWFYELSNIYPVEHTLGMADPVYHIHFIYM